MLGDLKRLASYAAKGCRAELLRTAETLLGGMGAAVLLLETKILR